MTNAELINRLKRFATDLGSELVFTAADRIEQLAVTKEALIAENKRLGQQCEGLMQAGMNNGQALIIAENKLAKAVGALEESVCEFDCPIARTALAEINKPIAEWPEETGNITVGKLKGETHD